jgi:hypothetical protein
MDGDDSEDDVGGAGSVAGGVDKGKKTKPAPKPKISREPRIISGSQVLFLLFYIINFEIVGIFFKVFDYN